MGLIKTPFNVDIDVDLSSGEETDEFDFSSVGIRRDPAPRRSANRKNYNEETQSDSDEASEFISEENVNSGADKDTAAPDVTPKASQRLKDKTPTSSSSKSKSKNAKQPVLPHESAFLKRNDISTRGFRVLKPPDYIFGKADGVNGWLNAVAMPGVWVTKTNTFVQSGEIWSHTHAHVHAHIHAHTCTSHTSV
jgi:hypothetical protein